MKKYKIFMLNLIVLLLLVGCGSSNLNEEDMSEYDYGIKVVDLLDEKSYEQNGKEMVKAVETLINASPEDFHVIQHKNKLLGKGTYFEESTSTFSSVYYYYVGEMKDDRPHGYGVITELGIDSYSDDMYIYFIGKFNDGEVEDYGILLNCERSYRYIVYEGEIAYLGTELLELHPKDGKRTLLHNFDDVMVANGGNYEIYASLGLTDLKVAKCIPKYIGEIKDGLYSGKGTLYSAQGNLVQEGEFEEGEFVDGKIYEEPAYEEDTVGYEEQAEDSYEFLEMEPYADEIEEIQEDDSLSEEPKVREGDEVVYFAGEYYNEYTTVSISQWSERDFVDIEAGEDCAAIDIYQEENFWNATLIKEGDNVFSIVSDDGALYYGTLYVTEEYVEITDSGDLCIDGIYGLNYLYIS